MISWFYPYLVLYLKTKAFGLEYYSTNLRRFWGLRKAGVLDLLTQVRLQQLQNFFHPHHSPFQEAAECLERL
jgi:hypothetical protein